jgi:cardiolipin synthase
MKEGSIRPETPIEGVLRRLRESRNVYRCNPGLRRSVYLLGWIAIVALGVVCVAVARVVDHRLALELFFWTVLSIVLYMIFVLFNLALIRDENGRIKQNLQLANMLTAGRVFLVAPMLVLLFRGYTAWGIALYLMAGFTDIADGFVARHYEQVTDIGVMLDPVGDILASGGAFLFLWISGVAPTWLFLILVIRYTQFFTGLAALAMLNALPKLHATITGKAVGVIQAIAIIILLLGRHSPDLYPVETVYRYLFPLLGICFFLVIVSQTVIGWKALRRRM